MVWLGPNDQILSLTPLWPRPDRSLFFFCTYVALTVAILAIISAPADEVQALSREILRQHKIFNEIYSSHGFWQWLENSWLVNSSDSSEILYFNPVFRNSFPATGAKSYSLKASFSAHATIFTQKY
jgi:hypothetical protein